jgi:hypothetical protein
LISKPHQSIGPDCHPVGIITGIGGIRWHTTSTSKLPQRL